MGEDTHVRYIALGTARDPFRKTRVLRDILFAPHRCRVVGLCLATEITAPWLQGNPPALILKGAGSSSSHMAGIFQFFINFLQLHDSPVTVRWKMVCVKQDDLKTKKRARNASHVEPPKIGKHSAP